MEIPLLNGIVVIFSLAIVVILICHKLRIPSVVGYLITGILAGPYGFSLIKEIHEVEVLAEVGIILLLFTIGIEFSFKKLMELKKPVLIGGSLQLFLTGGITLLVGFLIGLDFSQAIFAGFLVSLSSTAIVLKIIQERGEIDSPYGRGSLGILIFQDVAVVPMMLIVPILAGIGEGGDLTGELIMLGVKGLVIIVAVVTSAKWIIPRLLYSIVKTRSRELFLLSIVLICFAVAWFTSKAGLSLALGAFLAGLIISESEYSHEALGRVLPFRDIFISFFFVSIGMLFNLEFLLNNFLLVLFVILGVIILKGFAASLSAIIIGFPLRSAILVGLALSQVGEFAFILSRTGAQSGLFSGDSYNLFLSVSVISMALTPFIISSAPKIARRAMALPFPSRFISGSYPIEQAEETLEILEDHIVIIGYGINGKNVSMAASIAEIPYVILEMNLDVVKEERDKGEPIYQGDACQEEVLKHLNIKKAKVLVIAISDPVAVRNITKVARDLSKKVYIIVRTRYIREIETLCELGADEVIPEEFETSVEIFARVLHKYLIPKDEIEKFISELRSESYEMFRSMSRRTRHFQNLKIHIPDLDIKSLRVGEGSEIIDKDLAEIGLRKDYGVTVLAIRRNTEFILNPHGDIKIEPNDIVIVVGLLDKLLEISSLFNRDEPLKSKFIKSE
ncbi:MAG: potassium transporter KefB [Gracilibacter sp. BRH_c7a]|nr:MAG: potassium transporter KefB [Gracilibacter sp. BRH_c7a]